MNNEIEKIIKREREVSNNVATGEIKIRVMRDATILARQTSQTIGEKNDYYITLWQLEELLKDALLPN